MGAPLEMGDSEKNTFPRGPSNFIIAQNGEKRPKNTQAVAVGSICEGQYKGGAGCGGKEWKGRTPLCHLSLLVEGGIRRGEGQLQNRPGILPPMASGEEGQKGRRQRLTRR